MDSFSGIDHLDPVQVLLLHGLKVRYPRIDPRQVVSDRVLITPALVIGRRNLDPPHVLLDDALVCALRLNEYSLDSLFCELLGKRPPTLTDGVDCIVDGD